MEVTAKYSVGDFVIAMIDYEVRDHSGYQKRRSVYGLVEEVIVDASGIKYNLGKAIIKESDVTAKLVAEKK